MQHDNMKLHRQPVQASPHHQAGSKAYHELIGCLCCCFNPAVNPTATNGTFPQPLGGGPTTVPGPGFLGNDTVPCPGEAVIKVVTPPAFGSLALTGTPGGFLYTPTTVRDDSFTYEIVCPTSGLESRYTLAS